MNNTSIKNRVIVERAVQIDNNGNEEVLYSFYFPGNAKTENLTYLPEINAYAMYTILKRYFERKEDDK